MAKKLTAIIAEEEERLAEVRLESGKRERELLELVQSNVALLDVPFRFLAQPMMAVDKLLRQEPANWLVTQAAAELFVQRPVVLGSSQFYVVVALRTDSTLFLAHIPSYSLVHLVVQRIVDLGRRSYSCHSWDELVDNMGKLIARNGGIAPW